MNNRFCFVVLVPLGMVIALLVVPDGVIASPADSISVSPLFRASSDRGATGLGLSVVDGKTQQDSTGQGAPREASLTPENTVIDLTCPSTHCGTNCHDNTYATPCPDTLYYHTPLMTSGGFLACSTIVALVALLALVRRQPRRNT